MHLQVVATSVEAILPWRELHRQEMNCQIVHDSLVARPGWTQPYLLHSANVPVGYGVVVFGGPWQGTPAIFEFHVQPQFRTRVFDLFAALLAVAGAVRIDAQSNDSLLCTMLHAFATNVRSEKMLFRDGLETAHAPRGALVRAATRDDAAQLALHDLDMTAEWIVTLDRVVAGAGGILFHYNPPYGDVHMKVAEPFRRRGLGAYLVQELKRICHERGSIPAARCNTDNTASRRTLQSAGMIPCGHILIGDLPSRSVIAGC